MSAVFQYIKNGDYADK
ncbi:hypothetical protein ACWN8V_10290 [Vagococcus elongatus]